MDDVATRAAVSRATLYRLFPGKPALFRELITAYSPWEPIARVLDAHTSAADLAPEHVIPDVAQALAVALTDRSAVLLRMVFAMSKGDADTTEGIQRSMARGLPDLIRYLGKQMEAGRLRRTHPVLALQLLAGPIVAHELAATCRPDWLHAVPPGFCGGGRHLLAGGNVPSVGYPTGETACLTWPAFRRR